MCAVEEHYFSEFELLVYGLLLDPIKCFLQLLKMKTHLPKYKILLSWGEASVWLNLAGEGNLLVANLFSGETTTGIFLVAKPPIIGFTAHQHKSDYISPNLYEGFLCNMQI